jgi:BirA family transcriptional regulator, biotin operon repressor / biotin---[acetyl-CoA-carboxylase] ligase
MYKILANTIFLGKDVLFLSECHSTNDIAMQLIRQGKAREGSVVICGHQTQGKGQRGNTWEVEKGKNITFSLVLQPGFLDLDQQFFLNMMISNAVHNFLQEYLPGVKVKWPNDLVIPGEGKIGGILIENLVGSQGWEFAVVGIGLNINQLEFSIPTACSLSMLTGSQFDLQETFRLVISRIEQGYLALKKGKTLNIKTEYLRHLFLFGERSLFRAGEMDFWAEIVGISENGSLQLLDDFGIVRSFGIKEISFPKF